MINEYVRIMSALPPKADIAECDRHVRFVSIADIGSPLRIGFFNVRGGPEISSLDVLNIDALKSERRLLMRPLPHARTSKPYPQIDNYRPRRTTRFERDDPTDTRTILVQQ